MSRNWLNHIRAPRACQQTAQALGPEGATGPWMTAGSPSGPWFFLMGIVSLGICMAFFRVKTVCWATSLINPYAANTVDQNWSPGSRQAKRKAWVFALLLSVGIQTITVDRAFLTEAVLQLYAAERGDCKPWEMGRSVGIPERQETELGGSEETSPKGVRTGQRTWHKPRPRGKGCV